MFARVLLSLPVAGLAAAYTASSSASSPSHAQPAQAPPPLAPTPRKRYNRFAKDDIDELLDLQRHQRPPVGHAALNSGFAVELSSW